MSLEMILAALVSPSITRFLNAFKEVCNSIAEMPEEDKETLTPLVRKRLLNALSRDEEICRGLENLVREAREIRVNSNA